MAIRVIVPPAPLLTPTDIVGAHAADDARITLLIAAAQREIDGPDGWLGRALGPQTLEASAVGFEWQAWRLPCPPVIEVLSIQYRDAADNLLTVPEDIWEVRDDGVWLKAGRRWPRGRFCEGAVRVRYRAGYDGVAVDDGGTGPIPAEVKVALQLTVQYAMSIGIENLFVRSEEVEGVGTTTYTVSSAAGDLIRGAADRYLSRLRIYS
jgi:hypothetical protein